jgi:hypothetical protein
MLHENGGAFSVNSDDASTIEKDFQARVRETMEKAFWDVVTDSMKGDKPDYSQLINLVKEVRDSLHDLAPKGWKEEILGNIDVEILTQVNIPCYAHKYLLVKFAVSLLIYFELMKF